MPFLTYHQSKVVLYGHMQNIKECQTNNLVLQSRRLIIPNFTLYYVHYHLFKQDDNTRPSLYIQRCKKVSESETSTVYCDSSTSQNRSTDLTTDDLLYPIHTTILDYNAASPSEPNSKRGNQVYMKSKREGKYGKLSS